MDGIVPGNFPRSAQQLFPEAYAVSETDCWFRTVSDHPLRCQPGDLFFASETRSRDGHDYVDRALARGACGVVAERLVPADAPVFIVENVREAYAKACQELAGRPAQRLATTAVLSPYDPSNLFDAFHATHRTSGLRSGLLSKELFSVPGFKARTEGKPLRAIHYADCLGQFLEAGCRHAFVETSAASLAEGETGGIEFDSALILPDPLAGRRPTRRYRRAIERLLEQLRPGALVICHARDAYAVERLERFEGSYLAIGSADDDGPEISLRRGEAGERSATLRIGRSSAIFRPTGVSGDELDAYLFAATAGHLHGLSLADLARGLERVRHAAGRLEPVDAGQPFSVFVDESTGGRALQSTLRQLRSRTRGRLIGVLAASENERSENRALAGRILERYCHRTIFSRRGDSADLSLDPLHDFLDGMLRPEKGRLIPRREVAIAQAFDEAKAGDVVVLLGGSIGDGDVSEELESAKRLLRKLDAPAILPFRPRSIYRSDRLFDGAN